MPHESSRIILTNTPEFKIPIDSFTVKQTLPCLPYRKLLFCVLWLKADVCWMQWHLADTVLSIFHLLFHPSLCQPTWKIVS